MSFKAPVAAPPQMKPNRPPMPGNERDTPSPQPRPKQRKPGQVHIAVKILVSLLVAWHVSAVFLAPMSIQPSSPLVQKLAQNYMQWYLDGLYLNHGYHFFAPEPGAGHLIRYRLTDDRGQVVAEGDFPNKEANWPRLLYHRYFMLAEQCDVGGESEADAKRRRDEYLKAFARELLRAHPTATAVQVDRIKHHLLYAEDKLLIDSDPAKEQYRENPLAYPPTYEVEATVNQRRSDLDSLPPTAANTFRQDVAAGWQGGVR